ncbi:MAG: type II toxin-antitoxin system death-on-curing family toxin [Candidatus Omnitrophica bacterium]|nr:type II toxin-antitoxin system death-on-curing family toxin [Candidatus Omnitrophota bacterium]
MKYLYPKQILYLYQQLIQRTGGTVGLRDQGLLEAAVYRPRASFGGHDLYPDLLSKVAALGHSLISNHPFVDGNKRVGFEAMRLMLRLNGYDLRVSADAAFDKVLKIANGTLTEQEIADWLKPHTKPYKKH